MTTDKTLLFVYGTLKRGGSWHHLLKDSEFLGTGRTFDRYPMVIDCIPYLIEETGGNHVEGELFAVGPGELKAIDGLEGHPTWYKRKLKTIMVADEPCRAYIYFLQSLAHSLVPNWRTMPFHSVFPIMERGAFD